LILNGRARINVPGGEAFGEGDTGPYGGNNDDDSSGVLRYVRVEFAGTEFSPDNELNGIAFQGVGRNTVVEFVQVHLIKDDGIEFFGGTVEVKYALCTGISDDSFDWTDGWRGKGQFWIAQQYGSDADQGIEADNNSENNNLTPRSNPTIYNITLIGVPDEVIGDDNEVPDYVLGDGRDIGILLREGTAGKLMNAIVIGFKEGGLDIDDPSTFRRASEGALQVNHSVFWINNPNFSSDEEEDPPPPFTTEEWADPQVGRVFMDSNWTTDPGLVDPFNRRNPDFGPRRDAPVSDGTLNPKVPPNDGFFEVARFIGAVDWHDQPNPTEPYEGNWLAGWTTYAPQ
jgi:hypothetical protein